MTYRRSLKDRARLEPRRGGKHELRYMLAAQNLLTLTPPPASICSNGSVVPSNGRREASYQRYGLWIIASSRETDCRHRCVVLDIFWGIPAGGIQQWKFPQFAILVRSELFPPTPLAVSDANLTCAQDVKKEVHIRRWLFVATLRERIGHHVA